MKGLTRIVIGCSLLIGFLGSAFGQNTQTDFDHQANFSQYKTYYWQRIIASDSLWNTRIENAINGQLAAKGWTQASRVAASMGLPQAPSGDGPAFLPPPPPSAAGPSRPPLACITSTQCVAIVAIETTQNQKSLQAFYDGFGGGWGWRGSGIATVTPQNYKAGTLVIDMYDTRTRQLLWRGTAEGTLSDKAGKNEKSLDKAVAKMFRNFPPHS